jgi:hypothetical protein
VVHDSENILLTFPSIRNELGKSNKVFDQASLAVANIASRMHTDMPQAALQLGKALNDPIKGVGALRRIGIQFTNSQVDQIKVLIASGNQLAAQKIILREVNREFGGSAKAAGKTLPAAFVRLKEAWEDARNRLVVKSLPSMIRFTNWLSRTLPGAIDKTLTAFSLFDTDPRGNALSRWIHRQPGGGALGGAFDYLLQNSGIDIAHDIDRKTGGVLGFSGLDALHTHAAVKGGTVAGRYGLVPGSKLRPAGLGTPFEQTPVKVNWSPTDPLDARPVILVADGAQIAKVVTKGTQKRAHAEGRGTAHR